MKKWIITRAPLVFLVLCFKSLVAFKEPVNNFGLVGPEGTNGTQYFPFDNLLNTAAIVNPGTRNVSTANVIGRDPATGYLGLLDTYPNLFTGQLATKTTTNLTEGSNLYYTDSRFDTRLAVKTTSNLSEGTNLYFTNARSRLALSASNGIAFNNSTGNFTLTKRQETYTGTTAGAGVYTVTYGTAYSVEPNVIISQRGGTPTNTLVLSASSTTGFTVTANNRVEVLGLLPTYPTLNGAIVNVIVTEK